MDMSMTWNTPSYSLSFRIAILLTLVFMFAGAALAQRNRSPLLVLTLPLWWNLTALFLALGRAAEGESVLPGGGRHAMAAGVAEAHIPLTLGLFAVAGVSFFYVWKTRKKASSDGWPDRSMFWCIPALIVLASIDLWLSSRFLLPDSAHAAWKLRSAVTAAAVAGGIWIVLTVAAVVRRSPVAMNYSRRAAFVLAVLALLAGMGVWEGIDALNDFAMRG